MFVHVASWFKSLLPAEAVVPVSLKNCQKCFQNGSKNNQKLFKKCSKIKKKSTKNRSKINKKSIKIGSWRVLGPKSPKRTKMASKSTFGRHSWVPSWKLIWGHVGPKKLKNSILKTYKKTSTWTSIFHRFWGLLDLILGGFWDPCWPPRATKINVKLTSKFDRFFDRFWSRFCSILKPLETSKSSSRSSGVHILGL